MATTQPAPAPTQAPASIRRIVPLAIGNFRGQIDLDGIRETKDLDTVVENIARVARDLIFRELVKRDPPALSVVPPPVETAPAE